MFHADIVLPLCWERHWTRYMQECPPLLLINRWSTVGPTPAFPSIAAWRWACKGSGISNSVLFATVLLQSGRLTTARTWLIRGSRAALLCEYSDEDFSRHTSKKSMTNFILNSVVSKLSLSLTTNPSAFVRIELILMSSTRMVSAMGTCSGGECVSHL